MFSNHTDTDTDADIDTDTDTDTNTNTVMEYILTLQKDVMSIELLLETGDFNFYILKIITFFEKKEGPPKGE